MNHEQRRTAEQMAAELIAFVIERPSIDSECTLCGGKARTGVGMRMESIKGRNIPVCTSCLTAASRMATSKNMDRAPIFDNEAGAWRWFGGLDRIRMDDLLVAEWMARTLARTGKRGVK